MIGWAMKIIFIALFVLFGIGFVVRVLLSSRR